MTYWEKPFSRHQFLFESKQRLLYTDFVV